MFSPTIRIYINTKYMKYIKYVYVYNIFKEEGLFVFVF